MTERISDERLAELLDFEDGLANEPFIVGERRRYKADVASALRELAELREQVRKRRTIDCHPGFKNAMRLRDHLSSCKKMMGDSHPCTCGMVLYRDLLREIGPLPGGDV